MKTEDGQEWFGHDCTNCFWILQCRPHNTEEMEDIRLNGCTYYDPITINDEDAELDRWIEMNRHIYRNEYEEYMQDWN